MFEGIILELPGSWLIGWSVDQFVCVKNYMEQISTCFLRMTANFGTHDHDPG